MEIDSNQNHCKLSYDYLNESEIEVNTYVRKVKRLFSLPEIYRHVKKSLDDPNSTMQDISHIIQYDIVLSARILGIINSAYFSFPKKITSIKHAISILGRDNIAQLILNTSITDVFKGIPKEKMNMKKFWRFSVYSALFAQKIAKSIHYDQPDDLFTAALLHDIGKLVMFSQSPEKYMTVMESADKDDSLSLLSAEYEVFGFTHSQVGATLLKTWELPELYQQTTQHHHYPVFNTPFSKEISIIHLAVTITDFINTSIPIDVNKMNDRLSSEVIKQAGTDSLFVPEIIVDTSKQLPNVLKSIYPAYF